MGVKGAKGAKHFSQSKKIREGVAGSRVNEVLAIQG